MSDHAPSSADLDARIDVTRRRLASVSPDDPDRPAYLSNLAVSLVGRGWNTASLVDLDEAVNAAREACEASPSEDPARPAMLSNLAAALRARADLTHDPADLDEAVETVRLALVTAQLDDRDRPKYLSNLAASLANRSAHVGDLADLDEAIDTFRQAAATSPADDPGQSTMQSNVVSAVRARTELTGRHDAAGDTSADSRSGPAIRLEEVSRTFAQRSGLVLAADHVSLDIAAGEFVSILGPPGAGKSTLLRLIAGLLSPSSGKITIHGQSVSRPRQDAVMLFPRPALLPWRTVLDNVLLPAEIFGRAEPRRTARARALLDRLGLADAARKFPHELTLAEQHRVSMCRALVQEPRVLLIDDPFMTLDPSTRAELDADLEALHLELGMTAVLATSSVEEAMLLSDRIVVLTGPPEHTYDLVDIDLPRPRYGAPSPSTVATQTAAEAALHNTVLRRLIKTEIDEGWIDEAVERYRRIEALQAEFEEAARRLTVTIHSPDGLVELAVTAAGTITDVRITGAIHGRSAAEVSQSVQAAVTAAAHAAQWAREKLHAEMFVGHQPLREV